ncbi:MAG: hypothetical protein CMH57_11735 [Myxococcales bacterium]|nr:hypothetical protein [Myxococcales bacterium]
MSERRRSAAQRARWVWWVSTVAAMAVLLVAGAAWSQDDAGDDGAEADVSVDAEADAGEGAGDGEMVSGPILGPAPTLNAVTGLYHTVSAQTGPVGTYRLALFAQYFTADDVVRTNDENTRFIGNLGFSVTPLEWLEPYLLLMARSNSNTFSSPETVLAQGDMAVGSKVVYPVDKGLYVGGDLRVIALTGAGSTTFDLSAASVKLSALGTFDATELDDPAPVKVHLNLGYFLDNSDQLLPEDEAGRKLIPSRVERFAQGTSAFNQFQIGLGVEVPLEYVTPLVEYNLGILVGDEPAELCEDQPLECPSSAGFGGNPQTLTLGVKGQPVEGLVLNGGVDIGLSSEDVQGVPATAPYNILLGLSYIFDPTPKVITKIVEKETPVEVAPPMGYLRAKLVDETTGKPVGGAIITYPDGDYTRQASDAKTGEFRSYEVSPGELRFIVEHPEYKTAKIKRDLEEGENTLELKLKPEGETAVIAGTVKTSAGDPAQGVVKLTSAKKSYEVALEGGKFAQTALVGTYTVAATVPGFMTAGKDVTIGAGGDVNLSLELAPRPAASSVTLSGNKILIEGIVPFDDDNNLAEEAKPILNQVAAAMFENPQFLRVRVESHVDDRGPKAKREEVTQKRAQVVLNYLVSRGVGAKRLEAKGFGSEAPLVPNTSAENRAINQRVEFTIITNR